MMDIDSNTTKLSKPHDFIPTPLPDNAFKAKIEIIDDKIRYVRAFSTINIPIKVINESKCSWPSYGKDAKNQVNIAYHWLDENQKQVESDKLRTFFPHDLESGEEIMINTNVRSPKISGNYILEFDLVQEHVCWFKQKNSKTTSMSMKVFSGSEIVPIWPNDTIHVFARNDLIGHTEKISYRKEDFQYIELSGWMASRTHGAPVDNITLFLDSFFLGSASLGHKENRFPHLPVEFQNCGWHGKFKCSILKPGHHLLEIYAKSGHEVVPIPNADMVFFVDDNEKIKSLGSQFPGFTTPLPPSNFRKIVAGTEDLHNFVKLGALSVSSLENALRIVDKKINDFDSILDFGCGSARVLSHIQRFTHPKLFGTDIDSQQIEWCKQNLHFANFEINSSLPPLIYDDGKFDFIYSFSVFTHMLSDSPKKWLKELSRILNDGGFLVLSTLGDACKTSLGPKKRIDYDDGHIIDRESFRDGRKMIMTCISFNAFSTIVPPNLKILKFMPRGALGNPQQDLWLLQKIP